MKIFEWNGGDFHKFPTFSHIYFAGITLSSLVLYFGERIYCKLFFFKKIDRFGEVVLNSGKEWESWVSFSSAAAHQRS